MFTDLPPPPETEMHLSALAPEYQFQREIEAIASDLEFIEMVENEEIIEYERLGNGFFIVTENHVIRALIIYEDMPHPGPALFSYELDFIK